MRQPPLEGQMIGPVMFFLLSKKKKKSNMSKVYYSFCIFNFKEFSEDTENPISTTFIKMSNFFT